MYCPNPEIKEGVINRNPIHIEKMNKKLEFLSILPENYEEVVQYIKEQNVMSSGNITFLTIEDLEKFSRLDFFSILMRNENNKKTMGCILSIPFPIKCSYLLQETEDEQLVKEDVIIHGCTSYLNVHKSIRNFGIASLLIKNLIHAGNDKQIFCSYQLNSFKLTENAIQINSWYRPINIMRSLLLGFGFEGADSLKDMLKIKERYKNKAKKNYKVKQVNVVSGVSKVSGNEKENSGKTNNSSEKSQSKLLEFYKKINEDKRFLFYPDLEYFQKFCREYPSFSVIKEKEIIGFFSLSSINVIMSLTKQEGKLCLPQLFSSVKGEEVNVMNCLIVEAEKRGYDVLYCNEIGNINLGLLKEINAIKNKTPSYFTIYNNNLLISEKDIQIPLF